MSFQPKEIVSFKCFRLEEQDQLNALISMLSKLHMCIGSFEGFVFFEVNSTYEDFQSDCDKLTKVLSTHLGTIVRGEQGNLFCKMVNKLAEYEDESEKKVADAIQDKKLEGDFAENKRVADLMLFNEKEERVQKLTRDLRALAVDEKDHVKGLELWDRISEITRKEVEAYELAKSLIPLNIDEDYTWRLKKTINQRRLPEELRIIC